LFFCLKMSTFVVQKEKIVMPRKNSGMWYEVHPTPVKCFRTVQRIYNKEAATSAVVGAEKHFDEVHYSGAVALSCKVFVGTQTTNQYGRETL